MHVNLPTEVGTLEHIQAASAAEAVLKRPVAVKGVSAGFHFGHLEQVTSQRLGCQSAKFQKRVSSTD